MDGKQRVYLEMCVTATMIMKQHLAVSHNVHLFKFHCNSIHSDRFSPPHNEHQQTT